MKLLKQICTIATAMTISVATFGLVACDLLNPNPSNNSSSSTPAEPTLTIVEANQLTEVDKVEYLSGEKFDPAGFSIRVKYDNNTQKTITEGFTWDKTSGLTVEDTVVTISYEGYDFEQAITVTNAAEAKILEFNNGVDYIHCWGDGRVVVCNEQSMSYYYEWGFAGVVNLGTWSWDGTNIKMTINNRTEDVEVEVTKDAQNNFVVQFGYTPDWGEGATTYDITYTCPYEQWSARLTADVSYPVASEPAA